MYFCVLPFQGMGSLEPPLSPSPFAPSVALHSLTPHVMHQKGFPETLIALPLRPNLIIGRRHNGFLGLSWNDGPWHTVTFSKRLG